MNHKCSLFLVLSILSVTLHAQYVGLNQQEIKKLQRQVTKGAGDAARATGAARFYTSFQQTADKALTETPNPIDTIRTEGLLKGNPRKTATALALTDMPRIYALALVYRVGGDKKYLDKAGEYLHAWATKNTPNGDPIDDTNLDNAIETYDMIKNDLPPGEEALIKDWLKRTADTEISSPRNNPNRSTSYNNWHSHRLKIVGEIAFAIGDTALENYTIRGLRAQVERNLNADGSSIDFASRDALHYHVYDLEPLLKLAIVLQRATGVDYYVYQSPTGSSIKKSVDWLLPYLNGQKTHAEFVNSTVAFDQQRAKNNEADYKAGSLFDPKNGVKTLTLAARFDKTLLPIARKLLETEDRYPDWQSVVNGLEK
ncbi:MAG: alginate lyase family protein [Bacteroidota bacterium]